MKAQNGNPQHGVNGSNINELPLVGCDGSIGGGAALIALLIPVAFLMFKRKKDE